MTIPIPAPRLSRKREAILAAALDRFLNDGFAATSMDGVAAQAGVSKATIYSHFSGKAELFAAVIRQRCEEDLVDVTRWDVAGLDARATLTRLAEKLMTLLNSDRALGLHRVVVAESVRYPELAKAFWEAGPGYAGPCFSGVFAELDRRGLLAVPSPIMAANLMVGMLKSESYHRNLLGLPAGEEITPEGTIQATVNVLLAAYKR